MPGQPIRPEVLEQILTGKLPPDQIERYAAELETSEWFADLASDIAPKDELIRLVREQKLADTVANDARIDTLITKLRSFGRTGSIPGGHEDGTMVQSGGPPATTSFHSIQFSFLSAPQSADELGRLNGYRVLKLLGEGGMGMVFLAEEVKLKRKLALKVMKPEIAAQESYRQRFTREAETAASVEHDHIIPIFRVDEENGVPYIAMPFLKGEPLDERLKRVPQPPLEDVMRIGRQMAEGLSAAHVAGLIHRDIKPANVWLEAPQDRVKILDFGLARNTSADLNLTQSGVMMGTPAYMAPEQARGSQVDGRADLFSLGVTLYQMTTGTKPFAGNDMMSLLTSLAMDTPPTPQTISPQVPEALGQLIMQLLEKDANKRPQTAKEVADRLRQMEANPTLPALSMPEVKPALVVGADPWSGIDDETEIVPQSKPRVKSPTPSSLASSPPAPPKNNKKLLVGGLGGALVLLLGFIIIKITNKDGSTTEIKVPDGAKIEIVQGDGETLKEKLKEKFGERIKDRIEGKLNPKDTAKTPAVDDGFVSLFNGKDLTGWTTPDGKRNGWVVKDGVLQTTGTGSQLLFTEKEYGDFHLRVETRINQGGRTAIYTRVPFQLYEPGWKFGYQLLIQSGSGESLSTGSISFRDQTRRPHPDAVMPKPDEWFTFECIARGNEIRVLVNGKETARVIDPTPEKPGRVALWKIIGSTYRPEFRKIEIKELEPVKEAPAPEMKPASPDGFTALFNGKDLTGWTTIEGKTDGWKVQDGVLNGDGRAGEFLFTEREYGDVHVRAEVRINQTGSSGLFVRAPFSRGRLEAYEAQISPLPKSIVTGGLYHRWTKAVNPLLDPPPAGEWFKLELIALKGKVTVRVNDKVTAEFHDPDPLPVGRIAIQQVISKNLVEFRKVEVKDLSAPAPVPASGKTYAFLVGVNKYEHKKELEAPGDLKFAESDVVRIGSVLPNLGVADERILTLTTAQEKGNTLYPSAPNVRHHFAELMPKLTENDTLLVVFAGYELQFEGKQDYALATADLHPTERGKQMMLNDLYEFLKQSKCRRAVILVDSCRGGESKKKAMAPAEPPKGVSVIFACSGGQDAYEHVELGGGVLSNYFTQGLRGVADTNADGETTWKELFDYVQKEVPKFVKKELKVEQLPSLFGELPEGGFKKK